MGEDVMTSWFRKGTLQKYTPFSKTAGVIDFDTITPKITTVKPIVGPIVGPTKIPKIVQRNPIAPTKPYGGLRLRGGGRKILTIKEEEGIDYTIYNVSQLQMSIYKPWDWDTILQNIGTFITDNDLEISKTYDEDMILSPDDPRIKYTNMSGFLNDLAKYLSDKENDYLKKQILLGTTVYPIEKITGPWDFIEGRHDLGGIHFAQGANHYFPPFKYFMAPFEKIDIRVLKKEQCNELLEDLKNSLDYCPGFMDLRPDDFYLPLSSDIREQITILTNYVDNRFTNEIPVIDLTGPDSDEDTYNYERIVQEASQRVQRVPQDYKDIILDQLIALQTLDLDDISKHRIRFFLTLTPLELHEIFDKNETNLWCIEDIVFRDGKTYNGVGSLLRWYETDTVTTAPWFYENVMKFSKNGIRWYLTSYLQCVMKNFMKLYLTFNNDIFNETYRYGGFLQQDFVKNRENFNMLEKYTRLRADQFGIIHEENFSNFKFKVRPSWNNLRTICEWYSDFRSDVTRLSKLTKQLNALKIDDPKKLEKVFYAHDLDELEKMAYKTIGAVSLGESQLKMAKLLKSKKREDIVLETKLFEMKTEDRKSGFAFQIALLALTLLGSQYA
jgi:hypothetical protein